MSTHLKSGFLDDWSDKANRLNYLSMKLVGTIKDDVFVGHVLHKYVNRKRYSFQEFEPNIALFAPMGAVIHGMECRIGDGEFQKAMVIEKERQSPKKMDERHPRVSASHLPVILELGSCNEDVYCLCGQDINQDELVMLKLDFSTRLNQEKTNLRLIVPNTSVPSDNFDAEIIIGGKFAQGEVSSPNNNVVIRKVTHSNSETMIHVVPRDYAYKKSDFILDIKPDMQGIKNYVFFEENKGSTYVMARMFVEDRNIKHSTANMKILVDNSASMDDKINLARDFITTLGYHLGPNDSCTLSKFGTEVEHSSDKPVQADDTGKKIINDFANSLSAWGGKTKVSSAISEIANLKDASNIKDILLISDGAFEFFGTDKIIESAENHRCFTIGVGNENHGELRKLAGMTGGKYFSFTAADDTSDVVQRVLNSIRSNSVETKIDVTWPNGLIWDVSPSSALINQAVDCFACFNHSPKGEVTLHTTFNDKEQSLRIELGNAKFMKGLHKLVQGEYIKHLEYVAETKKEATEKALEWQLLSKDTCFLSEQIRDEHNNASQLRLFKVNNKIPQSSFRTAFDTAYQYFQTNSIAVRPGKKLNSIRDHIADLLGLYSHQIPINLPYYNPNEFSGYSLCVEHYVIVKERSLARLMACFVGLLRFMAGKQPFCDHPDDWHERHKIPRDDILADPPIFFTHRELFFREYENCRLPWMRFNHKEFKERQSKNHEYWRKISERDDLLDTVTHWLWRRRVRRVFSTKIIEHFDNLDEFLAYPIISGVLMGQASTFFDMTRFVRATYRKLYEQDFIVLAKLLGIDGDITVHKVSKSNWDSGFGPRVDKFQRTREWPNFSDTSTESIVDELQK